MASDCELERDALPKIAVTWVSYGVYPIVSTVGIRENATIIAGRITRVLGISTEAAIRPVIMKKILFSPLMLLAATAMAVSQQSAQPSSQPSLGEAARQARAQKSRTPATIRLEGDGVIVPDSSKNDNMDVPATDTKSSESKDDSKKSATDDSKPKAEDWSKKVEAQRNEIVLLQRELDVAQREQRLRAAAFYADAGTQLRDSAKYAEDSRKEQETIDSKKQALERAQEKLADLQEQARKAGVRVAD